MASWSYYRLVMNYRLESPLLTVKGVGPQITSALAKEGIKTVLDLLMVLPTRYADHSQTLTIQQLFDQEQKQTVTVVAQVIAVTEYRRGRRRLQQATLKDSTAQIRATWFNQTYLKQTLKKGESYRFSGKYDPKYRTLTQPAFEKTQAHALHTGRIVPMYSSALPVKPGKLRRILQEIVSNLKVESSQQSSDDLVKFGQDLIKSDQKLLPLDKAWQALHFPDEASQVEVARFRLGLEELVVLIRQAQQKRRDWQKLRTEPAINDLASKNQEDWLPTDLPFALTKAQLRVTKQIFKDLGLDKAMNRLLLGDVGSGKTIVAGLVARQVVRAGHNVVMVAPTRILAEQHYQSLSKTLPDLPLTLITAKTTGRVATQATDRATTQTAERTAAQATERLTAKTTKQAGSNQPQLVIGTHAVFSRLTKLRPRLIIYDEQQRFGVVQRDSGTKLKPQPHLLTMTATPIPRSLALTLFAHLKISRLDELPPGRKTPKSWLVPTTKRQAAYQWTLDQLALDKEAQAFVVCPFIDKADHESLTKVAAAQEIYDTFQKLVQDATRQGSTKAQLNKQNQSSKSESKRQKIGVDLLHGRLPAKTQAKVMDRFKNGQTKVLVTTPIVEVGVDVPEAKIMIIESAERFGLASLHQLRGRVGRGGQQGYCLLLKTTATAPDNKRLQTFIKHTDGHKLAEFDLQNRGPGELFGTEQSGFWQLRFGSWTNLELIETAQRLAQKLPADWQSFLDMP